MENGILMRLLPLQTTDEGIMTLIEQGGSFDEDVYVAAITLLKDGNNAQKLMDASKYKYRVCRAGVHLLEDVDAILSLANYFENDDMNEAAILALKLETKNDDELCYIIKSTNDRIAEEASKYLNLEKRNSDQLWHLISEGGWQKTLIQAAAPFLKIEEMEDDAILELAQKYHHNENLCEFLIGFLKSEEKIMALLVGGRYGNELCLAALKKIKEENNIFNIFIFFHSRKAESGDIDIACAKALKMEEREEPEIIRLVNRSENDFYFLDIALPLLKLDQKTEPQLLEINNQFGRHWHSSRTIVPLLKMEEKEEDDIIDVLRQTDFEKVVCGQYAKYIKSEKNSLILMAATGYEPGICRICSPGLKSTNKLESELMALMIESKYEKHLTEVCLDILDSRKAKK